MSWKTHLNLSQAVVVGLFFLGLWMGSSLFDHAPIAMFFTGAALGIAGRFGFRALMTATCPACHAPGARQAGSRPITYDCSACGNSHDTGISEGHRPN